MGEPRPVLTLLLGTLLLAGAGPLPGPVAAAEQAVATDLVPLTIAVQDELGRPLAARAAVTGADGKPRPAGGDAELMNHFPLGGYFYLDGLATVPVPAGPTTVTVSRGFEYRPVRLVVDVARDTAVTVVLERLVDLSGARWFCGDVHAHARHLPFDYDLTPEMVARVARAEGLSVLELLDNGWEFTGGPHAVSDATTVLYFSYEHRNQIGGHLGLPGLRSAVSGGCCLSPQPPYPMLVDLAAEAHAQPGARVVLAHPRPTEEYELLSAWPGAGLGRELPVLEALGGLDALDVASYGNDPDLDTRDWFALLSAGSAIPPSAGTDAILSSYFSYPAGGWRVYARQAGAALDHDDWCDALAAGRCFVTSFPLVPEFRVGGAGPGETLALAGDSLVAEVRVEVCCAIGLRGVAIVADGAEVWSRPIAASPVRCDFDTTFVLRLPCPGWLLLRADGIAGHPALAAPEAVAYTNAVRVLRDGAPVRAPEAMLGWLERLEAFEDLVLSTCEWPLAWQRDTVLARVGRARWHFGEPFRSPPGDFALAWPLPGDTAWAGLAWTEAADPDSGDRVTYRVRLGTDSTLADAAMVCTTATSLDGLPLVAGRCYWWSVEAVDRAGGLTASTPRTGWFYQPGVLDADGAAGPGPPRARPNPSRGAVALEGIGADVAVYDLAGRRVAGPGRGIRRSAGATVWDGLDGGRPAAPGLYLARSAGTGRTLRIVRLR